MKRILALLAVALVALSACALQRPLRSATGFTAHSLCSEAFVAGRDPEVMYREHIRQAAGTKMLGGMLRYQWDKGGAQVSATALGSFTSRAYFAEGRGCTVVPDGNAPAPLTLAPLADAADPLAAPAATVTTADPAIAAAIDHVFTTPADGRDPLVKAIVIVRHGRIIAERYAPGYGPAAMFHGWSMAKSITATLIGMLALDGQINPHTPAPVPAWQAVSDPHHGITTEMLLRHTGGLPAQTGSGFDLNSRMLFMEQDTAGFAAQEPVVAAPGTRWAYSDANYAILSGMIRRATGGAPADAVNYARARLFAPLAMRSAVMELDPSGTPMGATHIIATARDWARFGWFIAQGGVVEGKHLLPPGWTELLAAPTPVAEYGYGAGFWTNRGDSLGARTRRSGGAPADSFFASGNFGQIVLVSPANGLVIVRLGLSHDVTGRDSNAGVNALARAVLAGDGH